MKATALFLAGALFSPCWELTILCSLATAFFFVRGVLKGARNG